MESPSIRKLGNYPSQTTASPSLKRQTPIKRIFTQPTTISKYLYCGVCLQVFLKPCHLTCGHTFCFHCINSWLKTNNNTCPQCRQTVNPVFADRNILAEEIIDDFEVVCPNKQCSWKGVCRDLQVHQANDCLFKYCSETKEEYSTDDDLLKQKLHENVPEGSLIGRILGKKLNEYRQLLDSNNKQLPSNQTKNELQSYLDQLF